MDRVMSFTEFDAFCDDVEKRHQEEFDALQRQKESFRTNHEDRMKELNQALADLNQASKNLAEKTEHLHQQAQNLNTTNMTLGENKRLAEISRIQRRNADKLDELLATLATL